MPIYTLKCERCGHVSEQGFTVSGFLAQKAQGFAFVSCGRCKRRGSMDHDFMADARTQSTHMDEYTFGENAPEEHLVGQTVTKKEFKSILKKHGLVESGKEGKRKSKPTGRRITEKDILRKWEEEKTAKVEKAESSPEETPSLATDKQVDKMDGKQDTIVAKSWPALKAQAKRLGIKAPAGTKRPELEQLVRDKIAG